MNRHYGLYAGFGHTLFEDIFHRIDDITHFGPGQWDVFSASVLHDGSEHLADVLAREDIDEPVFVFLKRDVIWIRSLLGVFRWLPVHSGPLQKICRHSPFGHA